MSCVKLVKISEFVHKFLSQKLILPRPEVLDARASIDHMIYTQLPELGEGPNFHLKCLFLPQIGGKKLFFRFPSLAQVIELNLTPKSWWPIGHPTWKSWWPDWKLGCLGHPGHYEFPSLVKTPGFEVLEEPPTHFTPKFPKYMLMTPDPPPNHSKKLNTIFCTPSC